MINLDQKAKKVRLKKSFDRVSTLYEGWELTLNVFKSGIFPINKQTNKQTDKQGKGFKVVIPKQMLQRLPIALAQVKAGNTSENYLNEVRKIMYSL